MANEPSGVAQFSTDAEIMKQALEGLREDLKAMRHDRHPPNSNHVSRGQIVNIVLGALLAGTVTFAGVSYWRSTDRLDRIEETARTADRKVDQITKDDAGRRAYVDGRLAELDRRVAPVDAMVRDVARLEKAAENLDTRLTNSREERIADNEKIIDAVNASKTELALLRQELQQTRGLIEGQRPLKRPSLWMADEPAIMLASMRRQDEPFMVAQYDEEDGPLDGGEIAASIEADRDEIETMRGWVRRIRDALMRRPPEEPEAVPAHPPEPRQAAPPRREMEPVRAAKAKPRKRLRRRPGPAPSSFTRALEQAFGRPAFRGPYLGSLRRHGMIR